MFFYIYLLMNIFSYCLCFSFENNCIYYKDKFGIAVSNFTFCAVTNSRPIRLCESCVDYYIDVLYSYRNLSQNNENNTSCYSQYINVDRLEILEYMYKTSYDLWNTAKCHECFIIDNGVLTHNHSEEATKFNILYEKTGKCINETSRNTSQMCNTCMDLYVELSDYYKSISNENENIAMCMDIVDLMNNTRMLWSEKCCLYRHHKEYMFIMSTCFVLVITILFYALTKLLIDKQSPAVFLQTRFAESLNSEPKL